jgi:hypothetical protein
MLTKQQQQISDDIFDLARVWSSHADSAFRRRHPEVPGYLVEAQKAVREDKPDEASTQLKYFDEAIKEAPSLEQTLSRPLRKVRMGLDSLTTSARPV